MKKKLTSYFALILSVVLCFGTILLTASSAKSNAKTIKGLKAKK